MKKSKKIWCVVKKRGNKYCLMIDEGEGKYWPYGGKSMFNTFDEAKVALLEKKQAIEAAEYELSDVTVFAIEETPIELRGAK